MMALVKTGVSSEEQEYDWNISGMLESSHIIVTPPFPSTFRALRSLQSCAMESKVH